MNRDGELVHPGATIGILGGGQLGRMLANAASGLGFDVQILDPDPDSPAGRVATRQIVAAYDDYAALTEFGQSLQVATFEFENVPVAAIEHLTTLGLAVHPNARALAVAQDRGAEKQFLAELDVPLAPWRTVANAMEARAAHSELGGNTILKSRRLGYDGKGQVVLSAGDDAAHAFEAIGSVPGIMEQRIDFISEFSIIVARGRDGKSVAFEATRNQHRDGILRESVVPSGVIGATAGSAQDAVVRVVERLDYVGVIAVEFFALADGSIMANEIAPRVHNSGHWTLDACDLSQFEAHIRSVVGWPMPLPHRTHAARMLNVLGDEVNAWQTWAARADARLHLYGKREPRPGRKMGHVTLLEAPCELELKPS